MPEIGFLKASAHRPDARTVFDGNTGEWFTRAELTRRVTNFAGRLRFPRKALGFLLRAQRFRVVDCLPGCH